MAPACQPKPAGLEMSSKIPSPKVNSKLTAEQISPAKAKP
jgi:hypothetical protein